MNESAEARKMFLAQRLAWPLTGKVRHSEGLIREWYDAHEGKVSVSVSGRDSLALLHLVHSLYPEVPAVYADTGVEFPEVRRFHRERGSIILRPFKPFHKVVQEDGWPVVSKVQAKWISEARTTKSEVLWNRCVHGIQRDGRKTPYHISKKWLPLISAPFPVSHRCCHWTKTGPLAKRQKETGEMPFVGSRVDESHNRKAHWIQHGCNIPGSRSMPLSIWTTADVAEYVKAENIALPETYAMGYPRTGCVLCGFGAHLEKSPNRFQRLAETHPKLWEWGMHKLGMAEVLDYMGVPYKPERRLL